MTVKLSYFAGAGWQFFDDNGVPLTGGKLYTYEAGTSTPLTTYTTSAGNVANANPIVLDAAGRTPSEVWLTEGDLAKFVVKTSSEVLIGTYDDISGVNDFAAAAAAILADLANTSDIAKGDALVGFKQASISAVYSGAVAKTVHDKLIEFVSIWDFIPKTEWAALQAGTSTYDCLGAFTNAINTGKSIDIRNGTFPISNKLFPQSGTTWFGDRSGVLKWTTVDCLIDAQSIGNWTMDGIVVDGNYTAYIPSSGSTCWGVRLDQASNCTIRNCTFRYIHRIGIIVGHESANPCRNITIENNTIHDIGYSTDPVPGFGNGIAVLSASFVKIIGNWVYNITGNTTGTSGINLEPADPTYSVSDIEIAFNKVTDCNCSGIQLYMGHPTDYTGDRGNINIHNNSIKQTFDFVGIQCVQFGYTYIRDNFLEQTQGILVRRYKEAKAYIEGNEILQADGASAYGIRIQDGIAGVVINRNRLRNINGTAISVDMFDYSVDMDAKDCLIQDNVITSVSNRAIEFNAGNFVISGNTMLGCAVASADFYVRPIAGGVYQSVNGYIGENTFVTASGAITAFINAEGGLMNNVQIGTNSYVGPIAPTQKIQTYSIAGRVPGVFMDVLPADGTWEVGDIIWRATPAAAGHIGWVCTTAGTPGTWKTFGTIQA
jgi:hypothetical protein